MQLLLLSCEPFGNIYWPMRETSNASVIVIPATTTTTPTSPIFPNRREMREVP